MNLPWILCALTLLAHGGPGGEGDRGESLERVSERMTRFYQSPSREEFDLIQQGMQGHLKEFEEGSHGIDVLAAVFLAVVHDKHGWPLQDLGSLDDRARLVAARGSDPLSKYVLDDSQVDPGKLDVWWVSYFATGDTRFLDRLIEQVGDMQAQRGGGKFLVVAAANWSVSSNCHQHPAVLEYVKSVVARVPPVENRKTLLELVSKAEEPDGP